jgi:hypothetical protein
MPLVESGVTNRNRWLLSIVSGAGVLALGVWAAVDREPAAWVEPRAYEYTVEFRCGMQFPPGQYTLTVANGKVIKVVGVGAQSEEMLERRKSKPDGFPTLGKLFKGFQHAKSEDADVAKISFDPVDGHPTRIWVDYDKDSVDDESCYDIVRFTAS